jgi:hypothetical protein
MPGLKELLDSALRVSDEVGRKIAVVKDDELCEIYYDLRVVPEEWIFPLWDIYDEVMDIDAIQDQRCYTRQTFIEALIDPDYLKVVLVVNREPKGMGLGTVNLEKATVAYINPEFLRRKYPDEVARGKLFYLTSGFFAEEVQHKGILPIYLSAAINSIYENYEVLVADVSTATYYIKDAMAYFLREAGAHIGGEEILGQQTYFALVKGHQ